MARLLALFALVASLALSACSGSSSKTTPTSAAASGAAPSAAAPGSVFQQAFVTVVNKVRPSVVEISTSSGLGSGIVFDTQGDIVTNDHVVSGATQFQVTFSDGQTVAGSLVGEFVPGDLAVVKASRTTGLAPATFADSTALQIGDIVLAIGNPLGLASSVTEGIVSFNGRTVPEGNGVVLPDTIQTSAAINPGNSGGALVNIDSQVIGIPTLSATDPQLGGGAAPGIGFAIPSNTAKLIAGQLVSQGKVTNSGRAAIGFVGGSAVNAQGAPAGVVVRSVKAGGGAANAGIQPGDVVIDLNGQPTPSLSVLQGMLAVLKPGSTASVTFTRNGSQMTVNVVLTNLTG